MIITSHNVEETFKIGKELAQSFVGGDVVLLFGNLGAGKTSLTQGIISGLGVKGKVNSPTFNIMKVYKAKNNSIKTICHIDAYRLKSGQDLINIGLDDYLNEETLVIIEWAELVEDVWPQKSIKIEIQNLNEIRQIKISR